MNTKTRGRSKEADNDGLTVPAGGTEAGSIVMVRFF